MLVQAATIRTAAAQATMRHARPNPSDRARVDKRALLPAPCRLATKLRTRGHGSKPGHGQSQGGRVETASDRRYLIDGIAFAAPALAPGLYVVATPIGNLGDVTLRALKTLAAADIVACEDTRVTRRLLDRYGIAAKVVAYHEHSGEAAHRRLLAALAEGRSVALVSDAGTPLLSDPGAALVADAAEAGSAVVPIPGASAIVATLSAAGLPTERFLFIGFLPTKSAARRKALEEIAGIAATLVLFESPNRIGALLADCVAVLGPERRAVVCREVTKIHETFDRGMLSALSARYADASVKGEIVLLIAPPAKRAGPALDVDAALAAALRTMGVKEAAQFVAEAAGLPRRVVYQRALLLKDDARKDGR
jgi:16S rRNA (cytidine1402-2'-O)-methyltransferase